VSESSDRQLLERLRLALLSADETGSARSVTSGVKGTRRRAQREAMRALDWGALRHVVAKLGLRIHRTQEASLRTPRQPATP
jgi:hypothetical protein